jgi:chromosomal replication initiator protein
MDQIWSAVLEQLERKLSGKNFETWIKPIHITEVEQGKIRLEVPNKLFREWLTEHYLSTIEKTLGSLYPELKSLTIKVDPALQKVSGNHDQHILRPKPVKTSTLVAKYTFDNFIVGSSNQFAHAACLAVATQPGENYNPLFIYGGVGLGKTHLVNAIGHRIRERHNDQRVIYLTSEAFMNELIGSLRRDRMDEFKSRFRTIDVLIVDDIQFLAGKERTQEEFFHTFNSLYESHKQIIITSDKFPKDIPDLEDRLRNRFETGLIADIQPPDMETRVAILGKKAEAEGFNLPEPVAVFLATHI